MLRAREPFRRRRLFAPEGRAAYADLIVGEDPDTDKAVEIIRLMLRQD